MDTIVILVCGLPASGKTRLATELAGQVGAVYIGSDAVRRTLSDPEDYSPGNKLAVYDELLRLARQAIDKDRDVVLDATFYLDSIRQPFLQLANDGCKVYVIEICAEEAIIRKRLNEPRPDSSADFAVYELVKAEWEPVRSEHLVLWSDNQNLSCLLEKAMRYLHLHIHES